MSLWGQLRAFWDIAGTVKELSERIDSLNEVQGQFRADLTRIDERTRKQAYRESKATEDATWQASQHPAPQEMSRAQVLALARARGFAS